MRQLSYCFVLVCANDALTLFPEVGSDAPAQRSRSGDVPDICKPHRPERVDRPAITVYPFPAVVYDHTYQYIHIEKTGSKFNLMYGHILCNHSGLHWDQCPDAEVWHVFAENLGKEEPPGIDRRILTLRDPYKHVRSNHRFGVKYRHVSLTFDMWIRQVAARCNPRTFIQPINHFDWVLRFFRPEFAMGSPEEIVNGSMFHVGITEAAHESLCVFHGKLAMEAPPPFNVMPPGCNCFDPGSWAVFEKNVTHVHHETYDDDDESLSDENKLIIDNFTNIDRQLYRLAVKRLLREALKIEARFNITVICPEKLTELHAGL